MECGGNAQLPPDVTIENVEFFRTRLLLSYCFFNKKTPDIILDTFSKEERNSFLKNLLKLKAIMKRKRKSVICTNILHIFLIFLCRYYVSKRKIVEEAFLKQFFPEFVYSETDDEDDVPLKRMRF